MKYTSWDAARSIEDNFLASLLKLVKIFSTISNKSATVEEYEEKMKKFQRSTAYNNYINSIVKRMVLPVSKINASTWRKAARKATKSYILYRLLKQNINNGLEASIQSQINRNATIISTFPLSVSEKVVEDVRKATFEGLRATEISKIIREKTVQHARASAKLIARTEVSKTQTALTRARAENVEKLWYVWRTEEDARVRDSHKTMDDVLIKWQDPPSPELLTGLPPAKNNVYYHAGEIYNCRCYPEVLLDINDVKWPHKVYLNGSIKFMSKKDFKEIF